MLVLFDHGSSHLTLSSILPRSIQASFRPFEHVYSLYKCPSFDPYTVRIIFNEFICSQLDLMICSSFLLARNEESSSIIVTEASILTIQSVATCVVLAIAYRPAGSLMILPDGCTTTAHQTIKISRCFHPNYRSSGCCLVNFSERGFDSSPQRKSKSIYC